MITIRNKNENARGVLTKVAGFEMVETLNEGYSLSFNVLSKDRYYSLVEEWQTVTVEGHEFVIIKMKELPTYKQVEAIHSFYRLIGTRQEQILGGTRSINDFLQHVFNGTGWRYETDVTGSALIANFGVGNIVELVNQICAAFNCEYQLLPNKVVRFSKQIGGDNKAQYRYKKNVAAIAKTIDISDVYTKITAEGADGLQVVYTSPNAKAFGEIVAEPIKDERYTVRESLIEFARQNLKDEPSLSIELDVIETGNKTIGEKVYLIYEPMDFMAQTRVLEKKYDYKGGRVRLRSVTLGNTAVKTLSDILVEQSADVSEQKKQVESRFEQTNEKITLAVDEIGGELAQLEIGVGAIDARVSTTEENYSALSIDLNNINARVQQNAENYAALSINVSNINLSVNNRIANAEGRIYNAESSINIQANQITNKVSYTDYNGNTISSLINQSANYVQIQASKINLNGAVIVNGSITGSSNIDISNNIYIGNAIYFNDLTFIDGAGGGLQFEAWNEITLQGTQFDVYARTNFMRDVSFYGNVTGVAKSHTSGLGIAYNGVNRLYVRINGSDVGWVTLSK